MYEKNGCAFCPSYRHIDCLIQALSSGCPTEDCLSYRNKEVRMDVCAVPPKHRAFLHLGSSMRDEHYTEKFL